jgi:type I restriction enzyme S subunit
MIDELRPYPEMKPTGLPWLGDVPRHWEVRRIKTLLKEVDNRSESGEEPLLSLRMRQGLVDHLNAGGKPIPPEALVGFRLIEPGQIVMNRMRAAYGLFGVANSRGLVSPDYAVFEPTSAGYNRYLVEVFRLPSLARVFRAESKGLGNGESGFLRLYTDRFGPIPIPYPPLDEQRLIVRFLDWHGAQTAKLIRAKKKLIALLNEQKQAIIHRAVTRGLDPNVKLKPSGIAWLGTVPEGWEVKRLRNVTELRVSNVDKNSFEDEISVRLCNYVDVYKNDIIHADIPFMEATASTAEIERFRLRIGDLIITKDSEDWKDIGVPALVETEADDLVCAYHLALLRPIASQADGAFLFWQLLSPDVRWQFAIAANGVTRYGLSRGSIKELVLAVPDIVEQEAIAAHLDAATASIRSTERDIQREIALIQEFRTSLIADVVTGKLDVRAAAAGLPEIFEVAPIDESPEIDDLDDAIDETEAVAA